MDDRSKVKVGLRLGAGTMWSGEDEWTLSGSGEEWDKDMKWRAEKWDGGNMKGVLSSGIGL
jgi:hypothetical protein